MKSPNEPQSSGHVDDLMVSYLEERLSSADKAKVEEHLSICPECLSEIQSLRNLVLGLRKNKTVFCPHPGELFELVRGGRDPDVILEQHLEECPKCREELGKYRSLKVGETMPEDLWEKVKMRLPDQVQPVLTKGKVESRAKSLWDSIFGWFKIPALAAGAVAAAILLVVVFYPTDVPPTMVGLSPITWDKVPKPKSTLQGGERRAAFVLFFNDFEKPIPQERIDEVYRSLEPDMELLERYQIVSPAMIRDAVRKKQINARDQRNILEGLHKSLDVAIGMVINVSEGKDGIDISCRMVDAASGVILRSKEDRAGNLNDLGAIIRKNVMALLLSS